MVLRLCLLAAWLLSCVGASDNVVTLTKFNFEDNVAKGMWFVKFYAPWCTHCKRMAPIWEALAAEADQGDWSVKIAEVDCTVSKDICERVNVKAFPTLLLLQDGEMKAKYNGGITAKDFTAWLKKHGGLQGGASSPPGSKGKTVLQAASAASAAVTGPSQFTAFKALATQLVTRFPTRNKIANVYIYGFGTLGVVVGGFIAVFQSLDAQDRAAMEHEKQD